MVDRVACLKQGKVLLALRGRGTEHLESPYQEQAKARGNGAPGARVAGVTRGRVSGELCYAVDTGSACAVFAQVPGTRQEQRLFHGAPARVSDLDFSFADEALACTVLGERGTSAIGVLADDGKGMRTVTEGDVVDCTPRWAPGGVAEIVYASAGIGRTKSGAWAGLSPFALHRLRFVDQSVEVLVSDAAFDYLAPVQVSAHSFFALRRAYRAPRGPSPLGLILAAFRGSSREAPVSERQRVRGHELVRSSKEGTQVIAHDVFAFDVAANGDVVYSTDAGLFRVAIDQASALEKISNLEGVERLVIA